MSVPIVEKIRGQKFISSRQGVGAGSIYLALSLGITGVFTYGFQILSAYFLKLEDYGVIATLWSATFLVAQILWIGITQTLAKYIPEREAKAESWLPVLRSVRHLQYIILTIFVLVTLVTFPLLTERIFAHEPIITAVFIMAVAGYSFSYFKRGVLSGYKKFSHVGLMFITESCSRLLLSVGLLLIGLGLTAPGVGIAIAPFLSVLLVRTKIDVPQAGSSEHFSIGKAFRFATPVLICMACAQLLANGGPIMISALGGSNAQAQAGLLLAGLVLTRIPQYVLSPVMSNLLPHLSEMIAKGDHRKFNNFVKIAALALGAMGGILVAGFWLLGTFAMSLMYKPEYRLSRGLLTVLALGAACYLFNEFMNQVLFAKSRTRLASMSWILGIVATLAATLVIGADPLHRVAYALAIGTLSTSIFLVLSHLITRPSQI